MNELTEKALLIEVEMQRMRKEVEYYLATAASYRYSGVSRSDVEGLVRDFGMESITEAVPLAVFSSLPSQMNLDVALEGIFADLLKKVTGSTDLLSASVLEALETLSKRIKKIEQSNAQVLESKPPVDDTEDFEVWRRETFSTVKDFYILNHPTMAEWFDYLFSGKSFFKEINDVLLGTFQKRMETLDRLMSKEDSDNADIEAFKSEVFKDVCRFLETRQVFKAGVTNLLSQQIVDLVYPDLLEVSKPKTFDALLTLPFDTSTEVLREALDAVMRNKDKESIPVDFSQVKQLPDEEHILTLMDSILNYTPIGGEVLKNFIEDDIKRLNDIYAKLVKKEDGHSQMLAEAVLTYSQVITKLVFDNVFCFAMFGDFAYEWLSRTKMIVLAHKE